MPHLVALGINAIELLPIQEFPTAFSMATTAPTSTAPENQYAETDGIVLRRYFDLTNAVLRDAGERFRAGVDILRGADNQLRALIDVCYARHRRDLDVAHKPCLAAALTITACGFSIAPLTAT